MRIHFFYTSSIFHIRYFSSTLVKNDIVENTDVCVIRFGAAGAGLAKELAET
jgi:hypothetical protein